MKLMKVPVAIEMVTGIRPPDGTWRRWVLTGLARPCGTGRVRLRTLKLGGGLRTSEEFVLEFIAATSNASAEIAQGSNSNGRESAEQYLTRELGGRDA